MKKNKSEKLPDVSKSSKTAHVGALSRVGMSSIELPVIILSPDGQPMTIPANISAFVSLDVPDAKGIHMSRLYLELKEILLKKHLTPMSLRTILEKFLSSHKDLSRTAAVEIHFQYPVERKALLSDEVGFRHYPVTYKAKLNSKNKFEFIMGADILYSSTCPCSAALARQLIQEEFDRQFASSTTLSKAKVSEWLTKEKSIIATPHAQRSVAHVEVKLKDFIHAPLLIEFIDTIEETLGTPVQSAVKRVDEQEFARLNAKNLMFCEDAARKLRQALEEDANIADYFIRVEHQESLHPHNAVAIEVKGVTGGFGL